MSGICGWIGIATGEDAATVDGMLRALRDRDIEAPRPRTGTGCALAVSGSTFTVLGAGRFWSRRLTCFTTRFTCCY